MESKQHTDVMAISTQYDVLSPTSQTKEQQRGPHPQNP